jgi:hypothetical protein
MKMLVAISRLRRWAITGALAAAAASSLAGWCRADDQADFFERSVRPLLARRCFTCHLKGDKSAGGLEMTSRDRLLRGGDRGPAIAPGDVDGSLLMQAVRRQADLKMPPDAPLSDAEIRVLTVWVQAGAVWPDIPPKNDERVADSLWGFQPLRDPPVPSVQHTAWAQSPVDNFVLERLEREGLEPNAAADKLTWLRRVTFNLIGLPPTRQECEAYLSDDAPGADERVVERLLVSRHYGERWARHWLDLVRFAETNGFEDDTEKPNAFRYRDYVIDALNDDLPYDQFLREQIAGDLLPSPRRSRDGERSESPVGSGFWWLGEICPLPFDQADLRVIAGNELENQIDTYGKAFLGLTIACARCHDHKFDPITSRDYASIAGALASTTNVQQCVETPERFNALEAHQAQIDRIDAEVAELLTSPVMRARIATARDAQVDLLPDYLVAAIAALRDPLVATHADLPPERVARWRAVLSGQHPVLSPIMRLAGAPPEVVDRRAEFLHILYDEMNQALPRWQPEQILGDFENGFGEWRATGHAFGPAPASRTSGTTSGVLGNSYASSYRGSEALTGRLVSPKFKVDRDKRYLAFFMCGGNHQGKTSVNLVLHSQAMPQLPPFWSLTPNRTHELTFAVFDLHFYDDFELFVEVVDDHVGEWGHISVDHFFFTQNVPPAEYFYVNPLVVRAMAGVKSIEELGQRLQALTRQALAQGDSDLPTDEAWAWNSLREWLLRDDSPLLSRADAEALLDEPQRQRVRELRTQREQLVTQYPMSTIAMVSQDRATPTDARVQLSANVDDLGDAAPRGRPVDLARGTRPAADVSSGRLDLANWTTSTDNPLTARVLVNRLWKYHFGRGIVGTPDNFGTTGEAPTHPELLDFLTSRFVESGWSIKAMHRLMVLSATYRQASRPTPAGLAKDPNNRWLHHMPIRRLEAECIRDAVLAATGMLDLSPVEGSVPLPVRDRHMLESVETPGLAEHERHRSVYIQVFRNFAPALFEAFDYPRLPLTTGQRTESAVPGQALVMLNSEFLATSARRWAERLTADTPADKTRVETIYWSALSRPPRPSEIQIALEFVEAQQAEHRSAGGSTAAAELAAWADYCHVVLNLSELIVVR